ncbi:MAG: hypothetical protein JEZ07_03025 [Phycisphaerae bacterium]|nr:hypothetical protein [Phycisphaerae bacterium]
MAASSIIIFQSRLKFAVLLPEALFHVCRYSQVFPISGRDIAIFFHHLLNNTVFTPENSLFVFNQGIFRDDSDNFTLDYTNIMHDYDDIMHDSVRINCGYGTAAVITKIFRCLSQSIG